jgi:hypothetical protein
VERKQLGKKRSIQIFFLKNQTSNKKKFTLAALTERLEARRGR